MSFTGVTPLEVTLKNVSNALDEALEVPLHTASIEEIGDWVTTVQTVLTNKMDALRTKSVAVAESQGLGAEHGMMNTGQYVAARTGVNPEPVRADARLGKWLAGYPIFADAMAAGTLSREHALELKKADNARIGHQMLLAQDMFVEAAQTCDWKGFGDAITYWLFAVDPDGAKPSEQEPRNRFTCRKQPDGRWTGTFNLDPISGAAVNNAVNQEHNRLFDEDSESGVTRSTAVRRAAALVAVIVRGASRSADGKLPAPLIHVVMGMLVAQDLAAKLDSDSGFDEPVETSATDIDRRCELVDGTPIHPDYALAILAVARLKRMILGPDSEILDLGQGTRSFPKRFRLAMLAAARGRCSSPGCDAPFAWLQADHRTPASKRGPTSTDNGDILCGPENRNKSDN